MDTCGVRARKAVTLLGMILILLLALGSVLHAAEEEEKLTPLTNFAELGVEDLDRNYYALVVEWTQKGVLSNDVQVEVCYVDPRMAVALGVMNGEVNAENLAEFVEELALQYAQETPFVIKLSHDSNRDLLNLRDWTVTLKNNAGDEFEIGRSSGQPELRTSYSRGNYYQASYGLLFHGGYNLSSSTKWMKIEFSRGGSRYELMWDFQAQVKEEDSNHFVAVGQVSFAVLPVLLGVGLLMTRPKRHILVDGFSAN